MGLYYPPAQVHYLFAIIPNWYPKLETNIDFVEISRHLYDTIDKEKKSDRSVAIDDHEVTKPSSYVTNPERDNTHA